LSTAAPAADPAPAPIADPVGGPPPVILVMGVSGSGKTTAGSLLAQRLGWIYAEADAFHPAANVAKMAAGHPLDDADRAPWLDAIGAWIDAELGVGRSGVITCSALKRAYRDRLVHGRPGVRFVFIQLDQADVAARIAGRKGHFMPPSLLASQFADLQPPGADEPVIVVDGAQPIEAQVEAVVSTVEGPRQAG
jgi:gluconokinase